MVCVLFPTVVSMALRGQAIHPVTTLSLPQIVPSYCENKPELGQPENERPHGDNVTGSRLFVMALIWSVYLNPCRSLFLKVVCMKRLETSCLEVRTLQGD